MEEASKRWPAMAVPMTVKMPEPITAPMPKRRQRQRAQSLSQTMGRILRFADQLVDGFCGEDLF